MHTTPNIDHKLGIVHQVLQSTNDVIQAYHAIRKLDTLCNVCTHSRVVAFSTACGDSSTGEGLGADQLQDGVDALSLIKVRQRVPSRHYSTSSQLCPHSILEMILLHD